MKFDTYQNNSTKHKVRNLTDALPSTKHRSNSSKKLCFNEILNSPQNGTNRSGHMINFLKERFGKDKVNHLINYLDSSDNHLETLQKDFELREILGEDYKIAQNFLRYIISNSK